MNVLVMGSGGREHALALKIKNSQLVDKLYVMPGNPGTSFFACNVDINPMNNEEVVKFCLERLIGVVIPGSEIFLANGISDELDKVGIYCFGPNKKAANLESSKVFAKELMRKYDIPTAKYEVFEDYSLAVNYIKTREFPIVIKYDGLASGKGVVVAKTYNEALEALKSMFITHKFGFAKVVIEEYLEGPEFSFLCFVDNNRVIPMPICQDHKRLLDKDEGPNTGGMGIYSPVNIIPQEDIVWAYDNIMKKVVESLKQEGINYKGFLYGGLILTKKGPYVIEFNVRLGDPEAEVLMPKLDSDLMEIILKLRNGEVPDVVWSQDFFLAVVMASVGYPISSTKGKVINGIDKIEQVYHMGTAIIDNKIVTNGGRVLCVYGKGLNIEEARADAYNLVEKIECDSLIYRRDIGCQSL